MAALALYLAQAPHVSGDKDASEFTVVLALGGLAHPTGYVFYTLLGHLFVRCLHALGASFPYAANAWSAVGGGVAIFFLHALMVALVPSDAPLGRRTRFGVALVPLAVFALDPMWTMETNLAEVYSWHVAWAAGTALWFLRLVRELRAGPRWSARGRAARFFGWGALCGLGIAHHLTSVLLSGPLSIGALLLARQARQAVGRMLPLAVAGAVLAPAFSFGVLGYRAFHPTLAQWPMLGPSWADAWRHLTGAQYHHLLGGFAPSPEQQGYLARYVYPILFPALAAIVAAAFLVHEPATRAALRALAGAAVLSVVYSFSYAVPDPSSYFMLPMALGLAAVPALYATQLASSLVRRRASHVALAALGAGAIVGAVPWLHVAAARRQVYENFEALTHRMWASIPYERGFVLWFDDMYARLHEYQWLRGEKPELEVDDPWVMTHPVARSRFILRCGFDPLAGLAFDARPDGTFGVVGRSTAESIQDIVANINSHTDLPVIQFAPAQQSVRLLKKPGDSAARPRVP